jgi:hypothetical protein
MRTHLKIAWILFFCLPAVVTEAQLINEFFHLEGSFAPDHGQADRVITSVVSEQDPKPAYLVAGSSRFSQAGERPGVFLARYSLDGTPLWHRNFILNKPSAGEFTSVNGLAEATQVSGSGFGLLAYTNSAPEQSMLIRTDPSGKMLWNVPVGQQQAGSLAYDSDRDRFLVLTHFILTGRDHLQLFVIDAKAGSLVYTRTFESQAGAHIRPVRVLYDSISQDYLVVGRGAARRLFWATETDLILIRVRPDGSHIYTKTIRGSGLKLDAADAAIFTDGVNSSVVIAGSVTGVIDGVYYKQQPAYTQMDVSTGSFVSSHLIAQKFQVTGLVVVRGPAFAIIGHEDLPYTVVTHLVTIYPADSSFQGVLHTYNSVYTINHLNGISEGPDDGLVMVGSHEVLLPWKGSPGNLEFPWLVTTDHDGESLCSLSEPVSAGITFKLHVHSSDGMLQGFNATQVFVVEKKGAESGLNGCEFPFRLPQVQQVVSEVLVLFPNPAGVKAKVKTTVPGNAVGELILTDFDGRILLRDAVRSGIAMETELDLETFPAGVYIVDFQIDGLSVGKEKLVVLRH